MSSLLANLQDDQNIPLADDDPQGFYWICCCFFFIEVTQIPKTINCQSTNLVIINDDVEETSLYSGGISTPEPDAGVGDDPNGCRDEKEEKARLISQVLELQNTLDGKSAPVFYSATTQQLNFGCVSFRFVATCRRCKGGKSQVTFGEFGAGSVHWEFNVGLVRIPVDNNAEQLWKWRQRRFIQTKIENKTPEMELI